MAVLNYQQNMAGVLVPRSEVLNARPWAVMKFIGFIIASVVVVCSLVLAGALWAGARVEFNRYPAKATPVQQVAPTAMPMLPAVAPAPAPQTAAPVTLAPAPTPPVTTQSAPALALPAPTAPAPVSDDEALERAYKEKLLEEGADP